MKSFYTLELFVQPGGARMSWLLVTNNQDNMKKLLDSYFQQDDLHKSLYLLLSYGTHLIVQTYQQGERTQKINLLPYISIAFDGYLPVKFQELQAEEDEDGNYVYTLTEKETHNKVHILTEEFEDLLFQSSENGTFTWEVMLDWENIPLEALKTPVADEFEPVELYENYMEKNSSYYLGLHNTEAGGYSPMLDEYDPFDMTYEDQEYYEDELSTNPAFCEKFLQEASAAISLEKFGFQWMTKEGSAEYSSDEDVQLARLETGDETIFLNYDLEKKEYQLNCSFVFTLQADLNEPFFQTFLEKYIKPRESKVNEYGNYDPWNISNELTRFRETVTNEIPVTFTSPGSKTIQLSLGSGDWKRMEELENRLAETKSVFVKPVCLARQNSTEEKKISQFYSLFSASLISIIAKASLSHYEFFLEASYLPDPENIRQRGLTFYDEKIELADLPLDLYEGLRKMENLVVL